MANQKKRSSLTEAFWGVVSRRGSEAPVTETGKPGTRKEPDAEQVDVVPGKGGQPIAANTPVNMTFTVTAKERYEWTLELRRRGLSALSVLRGAMNELLKDSKG